MKRRIDGWIFDAYGEGDRLRLWVITPDGGHQTFTDDWRPAFCVAESYAARALAAAGPGARHARKTKYDIYTGAALAVREIRVPFPAQGPLVERLRRERAPLYNADVHPIQQYHYERGHFPLAFCAFEVEDGRLLAHELKDDPWALDYPQPPLRTMHMCLAGGANAGKLDPNHRAMGGLVLRHDGYEHELEGAESERLETLARRIEEWDPDVITTEWGDSHLLPRLLAQYQRAGRRPPFSRDPARSHAGRGARSFYTYGRTVYQTGSIYLFGRWHFDLNNSFYFKECGADGLYEIARTAKIPVQRAARTTIGTALSSMQMDHAHRHDILIPVDKQQAEDFRPASALTLADKGGLVYNAPVGWYDHVVEYDFVSMYPKIMVDHNISPETVNCACCADNPVPEIGHHICTKRRGLVPSVLAPILAKRAEYKRLAKTDAPARAQYKARANAFKWILVCCFGYLGFKNARFGKIEAHECVNAWGREVLLRAKESVERRGYEVLHGIVDCLWIVGKPGMDHEALRQDIEREAGCPVGLEGVYKWIRFCPSKTDPLTGVPARYFGAFTNGEVKVRGLALRRRDTPALFKKMQESLLDVLRRTDSFAEARRALPALRETLAEYAFRIKEGRVTAPELAITFNLSRAPGEYVHRTLSTTAAQKLADSGVALHAGESVKYIVLSAKDKWREGRSIPLAFAEENFEYDVEAYLEKMRQAGEEILAGL